MMTLRCFGGWGDGDVGGAGVRLAGGDIFSNVKAGISRLLAVESNNFLEIQSLKVPGALVRCSLSVQTHMTAKIAYSSHTTAVLQAYVMLKG
jgi:hypothetical protein